MPYSHCLGYAPGDPSSFLGNEWNMADDSYKSAQEFLSKMDSCLRDWNIREEVQKLSPGLLAEITEILLQRSTLKPEKSKAAKAPDVG